MITKDEAARIWNCHNDIEKATELLNETRKADENKLERKVRDDDTPESFIPSLELWQKTSHSGSRRVSDVPAEISISILESYIEKRTSLLNELCEQTAFCKVAKLARDFMWDPENWENYEELKTSNSAAIPPEFMNLGEVVEDLFGAPKGDDEE